jgi:hypothetical protein
MVKRDKMMVTAAKKNRSALKNDRSYRKCSLTGRFFVYNNQKEKIGGG